MTEGREDNNSVSSWLSSLPPQSTLSAPNPTSPLEHRPRLSRKRKAEHRENASSILKLPNNTCRLTRRALVEIRANMNQGQQTPKAPRTTKTAETGLNTPNSSKNSSRQPPDLKLTGNPHEVRESLKKNGMRLNDNEAWENRGGILKEKVDDIIRRERASRASEDSTKAMSRIIRQECCLNEATFVKDVKPRLFKEEFHAPTNKRDVAGNIIYTVQSYDSVGLRCVEQPRYVCGLVPGQEFSRRDKQLGLTNPNPDHLFGTSPPEFEDEDQKRPPPSVELLKHIGCGVNWPFLVMEDKSTQNSIEEGENQAIRDGAAIVNSRLKLKEYSEGSVNSLPPGAIIDIYCFSICWNPSVARVFVHWIEKKESGKLIYHMTRLCQYLVDDTEGQTNLRRVAHTIFDHGLYDYAAEAEKVYKKAAALSAPCDPYWVPLNDNDSLDSVG